MGGGWGGIQNLVGSFLEQAVCGIFGPFFITSGLWDLVGSFMERAVCGIWLIHFWNGLCSFGVAVVA